ncbi:hypothetical protein Ahy_A05g022886 [Arachis hypogaea]|uniref:SWIM-type domain-containing protein n=1 Tax=Arachis hypogaea TaxID=3818 RepID=A0A445D1W3_ARAHY|nr:hypothetical protein Ahy_A05g022886 [Arachis hypogaea]
MSSRLQSGHHNDLSVNFRCDSATALFMWHSHCHIGHSKRRCFMGQTFESPNVAVLITRGKDGRWTYTPDNKHYLGDLDVDRLDVFYLKNYFKELGYETMKEVWWQVLGMSLEVGLRHLDSDNELREMCCHGGKNNGVVDVYIEHGEGSWRASQVEFQDGERPPVKPTTEKDPPMSLSMVTYKPQAKEALPKKTNMNSNLEPQPKPKSKPKHKTVPKPKHMPRQNNVTRTRRYCLRSLGKGFSKAKENAGDHVVLSSNSNSHDSYESAEDKAYKPQESDDSSDESGIGYTIPSHKKKVNKPNARKKVQAESGKEKGKAKVCVDDDGFVEDVSDEDVDIGFVGGGRKGINHDAFDLGSKSDGANSWHSLEMKTPPNSGDELIGKESSEEVHGRPTNHVVDLEKRLCTCQFWMLTGIPCIHACTALARVNKHPEDFCYKLITMESYKETYKYHINPIPGQAFWKQSQYNRPLAPPIKKKPGNLQTKRRKDSDENTSFSKKSKPCTAMKRQLRPFTCKYCLQKVKGEPATRPAKLPARRRSPPTTLSTTLDPMKGASSVTALRFTNFLKFVPTPGFKHP